MLLQTVKKILHLLFPLQQYKEIQYLSNEIPSGNVPSDDLHIQQLQKTFKGKKDCLLIHTDLFYKCTQAN